ncbi:hypothetical protein FRC19_008938 [Serendipita sp. 401]|nr:hypothetical protein FRC18_003134 [Serendipita sp. 400]KAG8820363.1 hypothetical protein FRC19_008938 [Serendipita sp. 401]KAG9044304.1 hypothetical protein FS842_001517 [Serendipita sp. 407]
MRLISIFAIVLAFSSAQLALAAPLPSDLTPHDDVTAKQSTAALNLNQSPKPHYERLERRFSFNHGDLTAQQHGQEVVAHNGLHSSLLGLAQSHDKAAATSLQHAKAAREEGGDDTVHKNQAVYHQGKAKGYRAEAELERAAGQYHSSMNKGINAEQVAMGYREKILEHTQKGNANKVKDYKAKEAGINKEVSEHMGKANSLKQQLSRYV